MESEKNKQIIMTMLVLAGVALVVGSIIIFNKKSMKSALSTNSNTTPSNTSTDNTTTAPSTTTNATSMGDTSSSSSAPATTTSSYKDGTYSSTADFYTPEETDTIKVSLSVKDGVVSNVSAVTSTSSRESRQYDSAFLNAYKSYVVGKSLRGLNLNRVSGASLTTEGFNNALDMIRQQAQA